MTGGHLLLPASQATNSHDVLDSAFAERQERLLEADKSRSPKVYPAAWRDRPWKEKLTEKAAALLRSQL